MRRMISPVMNTIVAALFLTSLLTQCHWSLARQSNGDTLDTATSTNVVPSGHMQNLAKVGRVDVEGDTGDARRDFPLRNEDAVRSLVYDTRQPLSNSNGDKREKREINGEFRDHLIRTRRASNVSTDELQQDSSCVIEGGAAKDVLRNIEKDKTMQIFSNETSFSIALAWAGNGVLLLLTTTEYGFLVAPSTLYRSTNNGRMFVNISQKINGAFIRRNAGLLQSPLNKMKFILVAYRENDAKSDLWITVDAGSSFQLVSLQFTISSKLYFHAKREDWILAKSSYVDNFGLWVSTDFGRNWKKISDNVDMCRWGRPGHDSEETIYFTYSPHMKQPGYTEKPDAFLHKSTELGDKPHIVFEHVHSFGVQGPFIFASILDTKNSSLRHLFVSKDGAQSWNQVQLPSITKDQFFTILDMSEDMVFLHIDNPGDTGHGTIYMSDADGIIYSESLKRHLYPNRESVNDFYKVKSMRGVYLASQLLEDNSITTKITYNRGGAWMDLPKPEGAPCKDLTKSCHLQISNEFSRLKGVDAPMGPLSVEAAPGVILSHGHTADTLKTTIPDLYVSNDGGYTWRKALSGAHHYAIADFGGLLLAVPLDKEDRTNTLRFSVDNGITWSCYKFINVSIYFRGLLTEPGNEHLHITLWGFKPDTLEWTVTVINFEHVLLEQCSDTDFETWLAHSNHVENGRFSSGCLLGKKQFFKRKKKAWCYIGSNDLTNSKEEICACTKYDYECDYGFQRDTTNTGTMKCVENPAFKGKPLQICVDGLQKKLETPGYRKIPGDTCAGGWSPGKDTLIDLAKTCKDRPFPSAEARSGKNSHGGFTEHHRSKLKGFLITFFVVFVLLIAVCAAVYAYRKSRYYRIRRAFHYNPVYGTDFARRDTAYNDRRPSGVSNNTTDSLDDEDDDPLTATIHGYPSTEPRHKPSDAAGVQPSPLARGHDESDEDLILNH